MKTQVHDSARFPIAPFLRGLVLCGLIGSTCHGQGNIPTTPAATVSQAVGSLAATSPVDSLTFDFNQDIGVQLISFDEMYGMALAYSPAVKFEGAVASSQEAAFRLSKLQVLQNVTGFANYSTGNQAIISTGTAAISDQLGQISNGYRTGVNLVVSMHDLFGRSQQIHLARSNYEATMERKRTATIQLKHDLFNLYQDLLLSQRILKIRLQDDQSSLAAYRIAEVELQKGKITPEAAAFNSNRYAETRTTVEQAKTQLIKNIYALELAVGVPIRQLKR